LAIFTAMSSRRIGDRFDGLDVEKGSMPGWGTSKRVGDCFGIRASNSGAS